MTPEERKALREKHYSSESFECCTPECMADDCLSNYPCDVIKALDATEPVIDNKVSVSGLNDNLLSVDCDHAIALVLRGTDPVGINFNYCPKCGEKL